MQKVESIQTDIRKIIEKPDGTREYILNDSKELKAIENNELNLSLAEKLGKAYKPLFVNTFIRIIKREKTDILKIISKEFKDIDFERAIKEQQFVIIVSAL